MQVTAIKIGFHANRRRRIGETFEYVLAKGESLPKWVVPAKVYTPAKKNEVESKPLDSRKINEQIVPNPASKAEESAEEKRAIEGDDPLA